MPDQGAPEHFDNMTPAEFEARLPELFASGEGKVSQDPRLQKLFAKNPDTLALVRDLETIAEHAKSLFAPEEDEPSDSVWSGIASKLATSPSDTDEPASPPA